MKVFIGTGYLLICIFSGALEPCLRTISPLAHLGSPSLHTGGPIPGNLFYSEERCDKCGNRHSGLLWRRIQGSPGSQAAVPVGRGRFGCGRALYPAATSPVLTKPPRGLGRGQLCLQGHTRSGGCRKTEQRQSQQKKRTGGSGWGVQKSSRRNSCHE